MARHDQKAEANPIPVILGCVAALALVCFFGYMKLVDSPLLELPAQWLWVALVPILIGLVLGGYIRKLEFAGVKMEMPDLPYYAPTAVASAGAKSFLVIPPDAALHAAWKGSMGHARSLFLVHILQPSKTAGQKYDVSVYLMRDIRGKDKKNQTTDFEDVEKAEFYFGEGWPGAFPVKNEGGHIGVNTSAWGQFLAVCRVTFKPGANGETQTAILHRYIDFEMAERRS